MSKKILMMAMTLLTFVGGIHAENVFGTQDAIAYAGAKFELPVIIDNDDAAQGCEFYVELPEGFSIQIEEITNVIECTFTERSKGYTAKGNYLDGKYKILMYGDDVFSDNSGAVLNIIVSIDKDIECKDYEVEFSDYKIFDNGGFTLSSNSEAAISKISVLPEIEDFQFYAKNIVVEENETETTIYLLLKNSEAVTSFELNISFPQGISPQWNDEDECYDISNSDRFTNTKGKKSSFPDLSLEDGVWTISGSSLADITADDEILLTIPVSVTATSGIYSVSLSNQTITKSDKYEANPSDYTTTVVVEGTGSATMSIGGAKWGTFIAPFDVDVPSGVTACTVPAVNGNTLVLDEVENTIPANTPVVVYSETPVNETFTGSIKAKKNCYTVGLLTGVYNDYVTVGGEYVLQNNGGKVGFYHVDDVKPTVTAGHAYLTLRTLANPVNSLILSGNDETAVNTVKEATESADIYDIAGRRIASAAKGVYIINGKKSVKK